MKFKKGLDLMSENNIIWDLTEVFMSCDDPRIAETLDFLMTMVNDLISHFEGKISVSGFTAQDLIDLLKQYEDILAIMQEVLVYSLNSFRANTSLLETKTLYYKFFDILSIFDYFYINQLIHLETFYR